jgi:hypothetical protein
MKKTLCYSVRLKSLESISPMAYKATAFDGSTDILPKSQVFDADLDVSKSDAYWIAAWILEKKDLQYSDKKKGWWNPKTHRVEPHYNIEVEKHIPAKIEPIKTDPNASLIR